MEVWKKYKDYNIEVSNTGKVRTTERDVLYKDGRRHHYDSKELKQHIIRQYYYVTLSIDGKSKNFRVNRLVAECFIENPYNLPIVNHKDENKLNNSADNLEWCTASYNNTYNDSHLKRGVNLQNKRSKKVYQYSLDGTLIKIWPSIREIRRVKGYDNGQISKCCNNKLKNNISYGYIWKYSID